MQYIQPTYEILPIPQNPIETYKNIELSARTCYQSFDFTTADSYIRLIDLLIGKEHEAMIEHGIIRLELNKAMYYQLRDKLPNENLHIYCTSVNLKDNKCFCSRERGATKTRNIISGNARAWRNLIRLGIVNDKIEAILVQNFPLLIADLYKTNPSKLNELLSASLCPQMHILYDTSDLTLEEKLYHTYYTIRFKGVNRGFSHEMVRMRGAEQEDDDMDFIFNDIDQSLAQESTRFVDNTKDKFGKCIYITEYYDFDTTGVTPEARAEMERGWKVCEEVYFNLRKMGIRPEIARDNLPIGLKTELVATTNLKYWKHIMKLRTHSSAHPIMRKVCNPLLAELKQLQPEIFQ